MVLELRMCPVVTFMNTQFKQHKGKDEMKRKVIESKDN